MAGIFKVSEVVSIAVEIEKRGEAFYREMAGRAEDDRVRGTLLHLAGEEVKHRRFFSELKERLDPMQLPTGTEESEYWAYVNDLIDSHFLFDDAWSRRLTSLVSSDQEAIHLAMGFEKESILFFSEMEGLVPTAEVKVVRDCIQEEREHLRDLARLLKSASG